MPDLINQQTSSFLLQSLQITMRSNIHFNGNIIAAQSGKKTVKNCRNSTLFQSGSHCLAKSAAIPRCTFAPFPKRRSLLLPPRSSLYRQLRSHLGILLFLCALTITAPIRANSEGINCARNSGPFNYSTIRGGSIFVCLKCLCLCHCICLCLCLCICFELPNNQNWLELLL